MTDILVPLKIGAMRIFVAVDLPRNTKLQVGRQLARWRALYPGVKWVEEHNLHLTLKFLGQVESRQLPDIREAVDRVCRRFSSFRVRFGRLGGFGPAGNVRVLWLGVTEGAEELRALAEAVEGEMEAIGFSREDRAFQAHLTLARSRRGGRGIPLKELADFSESISPWVADKVTLFESVLRPEGPIYKALKIFPLSARAG